ncbi:MAG TPA: permease-like cell division protein FtsX [Chloroflexota bacterium]
MLRFAVVCAVQSLRRNAVMSGVAIGTTAMLLLVLSSMVVLVAGLDAAVTAVQSRVNIVVYLKDGTSPQAQLALERRLQAQPAIATISYVSKDVAMAQLRQQFAGHPELLGAIEGNPLPASISITLKDPMQARQIGDAVRGDPSVSDITVNQDTVDRLVAASRFIRMVGLAIVGGLAVAVVFVMINVARVAIYARRHEIEVMRLVGASNWFVRWPFVLEGMFCGLLAAAVALAVVAAGYHSLLDALRGSLTFLSLRVDPNLLPKLLAMGACLGIGIGGSGSLIAVHRFWER